jgi:hypothetical protein
MSAFEATTVVGTLSGEIDAPVDEVFPLCCPVEEYRWIPGWKCNLVNCPNDKVELGTVFKEIFSAPFLLGKASGVTTWTAVLHESENHRLHFKLENAHSSSLYKIELGDDGKGGTTSNLEFTYRALDAKGNALAKKDLQKKIEIMLGIIGLMLKTYCETGKMIPPATLQKSVMSEPLSFWEKIRLARNRLAMHRMADPDRARFMRQLRTSG